MKRYTVSEGKLINDVEGIYSCYFILKDHLPIYEINKWLEIKSRRSTNTSRQYAYNLCRYLNYLDSLGKDYHDASKKDVVNFIDLGLFQSGSGVVKIESDLTYNSAAAYLITIKEFYKFLEDEVNTEVNIRLDKHPKRSAKYQYLYGQIWDIETEALLKTKISRMKNGNRHIKWYSDEQIQAILSNLNTWRDKSIFMLTLEGLRIDEVISLQFESYDDIKGVVTTNRSKGKGKRSIALKQETREVLDKYLFNERSEIESRSKEVTNYLFINFKNGLTQGKVVGYRNILNIIKGAARRSGLNSKEIRTHSGRSTRTMELLRYRAKHPEENITDEQINLIMGWRSPQSIQPYINYQDEELLINTIEKINGGISNDKRS